jgi:hypothetical protein
MAAIHYPSTAEKYLTLPRRDELQGSAIGVNVTVGCGIGIGIGES